MSARRCAHCGHLHKTLVVNGKAVGVRRACHVFACNCATYSPRATEPRPDGPINRTRRLRDTRDTTTKRGGSLAGVTRATGPRP